MTHNLTCFFLPPTLSLTSFPSSFIAEILQIKLSMVEMFLLNVQLVAQPLQMHVLLSIVALPIAHLVQSALDLQLSLWGGVGTCITLPYSGYFSGGKIFVKIEI